MSVNPLKALAAGLLLAGGLGGSVGPGFLTAAHAQRPGAAAGTAVVDREAELRTANARLAETQARLDDALNKLAVTQAEARERQAVLAQYQNQPAQAAEAKHRIERLSGPEAVFKTARHEYTVVLAAGLDRAGLKRLVTDREAAGWEFAGAAPLTEGAGWVFRRATTPVPPAESINRPVRRAAGPPAEAGPSPTRTLLDAVGLSNAAAAEAQKLQAEISALQARLAALQPVRDAKPVTVVFQKEDSVLEPVTLGHVLLDLGQKRFGKDGRITVQVKDGAVSVYGDRQVTDWAAATVKSFRGN